VLYDAAVAVSAERIVFAGPSAAAPRAVREIDARGGIVAPGFVNLHSHLAMTLLRGWADDRDLQAFLDRVFPVEMRILSPTTVRAGVDLALAESLRAGITTSADMYFHPEVAAAAAQDAGARIANGPVLFSATGPDGITFDQRLDEAEQSLLAARDQLTAGRWLCPHSTYLVDVTHLERLRDVAERTGSGIHIHAAENRTEVQTVFDSTGRRPVQLLHDLNMLRPRTILAHAVELNDAEIDAVASEGASVAHNPLSNMKLASGFARVPDLLRAGVTVGLGTDGTASSNDLDLYAAMRFAGTIHKAQAHDATLMPAAHVLRMATLGGAEALGIADQIGSIEVGKRADLQLLWPDHPNLVPCYDAISTLVFAAGRGDVRTVVIDGRVVLDDGRLTTIDLPGVLGEARAIAARVRAMA
jgi:5-methylthioadenosine/S-adenosylhomocysteine deaminase